MNPPNGQRESMSTDARVADGREASQVRTPAIEYWDCEKNRELLTHDSIGEAVYWWADAAPKPLPETVTVYGFARKELPSADSIAAGILDDLGNWLVDEYSDPDYGPDFNRAIEEAALRFAETLRSELFVWACDEVTSQTVNVRDYIPGTRAAAPTSEAPERRNRRITGGDGGHFCGTGGVAAVEALAESVRGGGWTSATPRAGMVAHLPNAANRRIGCPCPPPPPAPLLRSKRGTPDER